MIKIEAKTLHEAYEKASQSLGCSVTLLEIEVIQNPSKGLFGLFGKNAIIVATQKRQESKPAQNVRAESPKPSKPTPPKEVVLPKEESPVKEPSSAKSRKTVEQPSKPQSTYTPSIGPKSMVTAQDEYEDEVAFDTPVMVKESSQKARQATVNKTRENETIKRVAPSVFGEEILNDFFHAPASHENMLEDIARDINALFAVSCFKIDPIAVSMHDEKTVLIEFSGEDAALLIGKEGYRYKALSYMIFNWINAKYDVQLRLEIAQFLQNQEEMIAKYLVGIVSQVHSEGRAQTKILDGVLVQIALKSLRETFPEKYVAIRTNREGLKYIIINSFRQNG
ncbi:MAG: hypothetical protein KU37_11375 [Sulfuricurvum sp. PC08-66]|nr:MAG: hypothetical protein KU37_11375 [Sulfuricurvum sp. PC08-66]